MTCLGTVALFEYLPEKLTFAWLWAGLCLPESVFSCSGPSWGAETSGRWQAQDFVGVRLLIHHMW